MYRFIKVYISLTSVNKLYKNFYEKNFCRKIVRVKILKNIILKILRETVYTKITNPTAPPTKKRDPTPQWGQQSTFNN